LDVGFICTSLLKRSIDTSSYIVREEEPRRLALPEFNEMDYGHSWDGKPLQTLLPELKALSSRWKNGETNISCPGGESPEAVLARAKAGLHKVLQEMNGLESDKVGVIVAHSFVNRILISFAADGNLRNLDKVQQHHGCVNILEVHSEDAGQIRVHEINFTGHMAKI